jgi:2-methylcitrate dehydratase PrpD
VRLTLTCREGSRLQESSDYPRGNAENPVGWHELEDKLAAIVEPRLGPAVVATARTAIDALPGCCDVATLFRDLP